MAKKNPRHGPVTFGERLRYRISADMCNSLWNPWETPITALKIVTVHQLSMAVSCIEFKEHPLDP
jgi:hypothetical protein